jgi:hypothetical protein
VRSYYLPGPSVIDIECLKLSDPDLGSASNLGVLIPRTNACGAPLMFILLLPSYFVEVTDRIAGLLLCPFLLSLDSPIKFLGLSLRAGVHDGHRTDSVLDRG